MRALRNPRYCLRLLCHIMLCPRYVVSGTALAQCLAACYAPATPCPVLMERMAVPGGVLRQGQGCSGSRRDVAYAAKILRSFRYWKVRYGAKAALRNV
eukprot:182895-Rhodomonas_salina.2